MKILLSLVFVFIASMTSVAQPHRIVSEKPDARTCSGTIVESNLYETNRILGRVVDSGDTFVPDVVLELRSRDGKSLRLVNEASGDFKFPIIPNGDYVLTARWKKKGFDCVRMPVRIGGSSKRSKTIVLPPSPVMGKTELR